MKCPRCKGTGNHSHEGEMNPVCPACKGSGEVEALNREWFWDTGIPCPPMLPGMIGNGLLESPNKYFALYYMGTCATYDDGRATATFSYYDVYAPLIEHMAVQYTILLHKADLGSDDTEPRHALLVDREGTMRLGYWNHVLRFVRENYPTEPAIAARAQQTFQGVAQQLERLVDVETPDLEDFHQVGMFELFGQGHQRREETEGLMRWLDQYINSELLQRYSVLSQTNGLAHAVMLHWWRNHHKGGEESSEGEEGRTGS